MRHDLWEWLEDVVIWLNREYTWDVSGLIPSCWPLHPHLVHEIAVLADQRRRAGLAMTSDALEEWHRYCLPAFTDRLRNRLRAHCDDEHKSWPAKPRHNEHLADASRQRRENTFAHDIDALPVNRRAHEQPPAGPRGSASSTSTRARSTTTRWAALSRAPERRRDPANDADQRTLRGHPPSPAALKALGEHRAQARRSSATRANTSTPATTPTLRRVRVERG